MRRKVGASSHEPGLAYAAPPGKRSSVDDVRMPEDHRSSDRRRRRRAMAASRSPRPPSRARVRRLACELSRREPRGEVRVQPAKRADRQRVAQHAPEQAIALVFARAEPVAVLDARAPTADAPGPRSEAIVDAGVFAQDVAAPAVVVAGDHRHGHAGVDDVGERRERTKAAARDHRPPLEPELEQVAVDDERRRVRRHVPKKRDDGVARRRRARSRGVRPR